MAKSIDNVSAKRLIAAHQTLLSELSAAENRHAVQAKEVVNSAVALASQEALQMLKNIPVEELNRDKRGIRVKALRDYGFTNVASVYTASAPSLACVHGISDESAHTIKAIDERITDILEAKQEIFDAFADHSVAAKESQEIDEKTYGNLIQEEIDRINAKRAAELPTPQE